MKLFRTFLGSLLILLASYEVVEAQTLQLTIANQQVVSGNSFQFDINMQATVGTVYFAGGDIVLTFNSANFTSPGCAKGLPATFVLNNTNGDNTTNTTGGTVGAYYRGKTGTSISGNEIIINVGQPTEFSLSEPPSQRQLDFDADIAKIDNSPYKFGTYTISQLTNTSGTIGLAWKTSGGVFTYLSTFANTTPWGLTPVTLSAINPSDAPLPVELSTFTAASKGSQVSLNWKTVTEVNNYGFEVERASTSPGMTKKTDWIKVGFVKGNGNSNSPKEYSFIDKTVSYDSYAYRLKQIDNDGKYTYSKEVEADLGKPTTFALSQNYPNPFNPTSTIRYDIPKTGFVKISVFDILGKEIKILVNEEKSPGQYEIIFDARELASGIYYYAIRTGDFTQSKKMIVLK